MRESLFRGKRVDNGEWVNGFYTLYANNCGVHSCILTGTDNGCVIPQFVIPETVGQFTGLTDKNDIEIFEGDIVLHDFGKEQIGKQIAVIKYDIKYASFMVNPVYDWMYCDKSDCEVIGNIHDNPELLKGGEGK